MITDLPPARRLHRAGAWSGPAELLRLSYEDRFLRRKRLTTEAGAGVLVDLPETISLADGDALECDDGRFVAIEAADEPLVEVRGPDLVRLAWHVGNRHTPCQIAADRLVIARDHVLEAMLTGLGATLSHVTAPFRPEGGAYGLGRTLGHDHAPAAGSDHSHDHSHGPDEHGHARRHVHHHVSHRHDEEDTIPDIDPGR